MPASRDDQRHDRIRGFDGLRAIGFLLVFVSHKYPSFRAEMYGELGVWLFFVLSGYLITRIARASRLQIELGSTSYGDALKHTLIARCARIMPVYFLLLAAITVASLFITVPNFSLIEQAAYWTFTTNILVGVNGWIGRFGHLWTLAAEVQYYTSFLVLALALPSRRIAMLCLCFVVLGAMAHIMLVRAGAGAALLDVHPGPSFALFGLGGLAGLAADQAWLRRATTASLIPIALAAFLASPLFFDAFYAFLASGRAAAVLAILILLSVHWHQGSVWVRALEWGPLRNLGQISYGAYLFHNFISLAFLVPFLTVATGSETAAASLRTLLELAATIALAALSWRALERPLQGFARRTFIERRAPAPGGRPRLASAAEEQKR